MGCGQSHPVAASPSAVADASPCRFHQEYVLGEKLGAGAFGSVYLARSAASGEDVAVKVLDSRSEDIRGCRFSLIDRRRQRAIEREVAILESLPCSDFVVKFYGLYMGEEGLAYMVMERCDIALLALLESLPVLTESTMRPIFADMLSAIAVCHGAGIVHRDVKIENFLVAARDFAPLGYQVKLCDFGLASRVPSEDAEELTGVWGTAPYMAPEMLLGQPHGAKVDVWAVGALAYVLLYGAWPYAPKVLSREAIKDAIRDGTSGPTYRGPAEISANCSAWVRALLCRDPSQRPSAAQAATSRMFCAPWGGDASLHETVRAASGCGAFEQPSLAEPAAASVELHEMLSRMNTKCHGPSAEVMSELSTEVWSVSSWRHSRESFRLGLCTEGPRGRGGTSRILGRVGRGLRRNVTT